jgi:serine protease Do
MFMRIRTRRFHPGRLGSTGPGAALVAALLLALAAPSIASAQSRGGSSAGQRAVDPVEIASALSDAFARVAERVQPAVVTINSEKVVKAEALGGYQNPGMPDYFERFFGPFRRETPQREYRQRGLGSGFIVSADGVILTANHVVQSADKVRVRLFDDRELSAEIVGTDPKTDVAVLRVKTDDPLPTVTLGDSDDLRVGDWVVALGNPFGEGLRGTVTAGIISAKGRSRIGLADYEDFIQTDAAINPGNSGGPLVNLRGEVVGVNTAIASRTGGYQGVGFAVPIDMAARIKDAILSDGRVVRGWLGIYVGDLSESLREAFQVPGKGGALVQQVVKDSPAETAGLKDGDILLELDGRPLVDGRDLRFAVAEMRPGARVELLVLRDGERRTVAVELGELDSEELAGREPAADDPSGRLGFVVEDVTRDVRRELGLDGDVEGVVVTEVEPGSLAEDEGLRQGDVILEVDRRTTADLETFRDAVEKTGPGEILLLTVLSAGGQHFLALRMPED